MNALKHSHDISIRTTPEELWDAITNPARTPEYWYGALNRSAWVPGARWTSESSDGELYLDGEILEVDRPHRLVQTFHVVHEAAAAAEAPARLTFQITDSGDACRLLVVHDDLGPATLAYIEGGWEHILAGLKAYLETGPAQSRPPSWRWPDPVRPRDPPARHGNRRRSCRFGVRRGRLPLRAEFHAKSAAANGFGVKEPHSTETIRLSGGFDRNATRPRPSDFRRHFRGAVAPPAPFRRVGRPSTPPSA